MEHVLCLTPVMERLLWAHEDKPFSRYHLRRVSRGFRDSIDALLQKELPPIPRGVSLDVFLRKHQGVSVVRVNGTLIPFSPNKDEKYPLVTHFESLSGDVIYPEVIGLFPNLKKLLLRISLYAQETSLPFLEELEIGRPPGERLLEAFPSLKRLKVSREFDVLRIVGKSMDRIQIYATGNSLHIELESCGRLDLGMRWPGEATVTIQKVGILRIDSLGRSTTINIDRVDVFYLDSQGDSPTLHKEISSIGTLILDMAGGEIDLTEISVENLVIYSSDGCEDCRCTAITGSCPSLKRIVFNFSWQGWLPLIEVDLEFPVTLILDMPSETLHRMEMSLSGINRIAHHRSSDSQYDRRSENVYPKTPAEDEDVWWYAHQYFVPLGGHC